MDNDIFSGNGKIMFTCGYYNNFSVLQQLQQWRLKAYSLMLNRGRSQNFQILIFLHIFVALLY